MNHGYYFVVLSEFKENECFLLYKLSLRTFQGIMCTSVGNSRIFLQLKGFSKWLMGSRVDFRGVKEYFRDI